MPTAAWSTSGRRSHAWSPSLRSWPHERAHGRDPRDRRAAPQPLEPHAGGRGRRAGRLLRAPPRSLPRLLRRPHAHGRRGDPDLPGVGARDAGRGGGGLGRHRGAPPPPPVGPGRARPDGGRPACPALRGARLASGGRLAVPADRRRPRSLAHLVRRRGHRPGVAPRGRNRGRVGRRLARGARGRLPRHLRCPPRRRRRRAHGRAGERERPRPPVRARARRARLRPALRRVPPRRDPAGRARRRGQDPRAPPGRRRPAGGHRGEARRDRLAWPAGRGLGGGRAGRRDRSPRACPRGGGRHRRDRHRAGPAMSTAALPRFALDADRRVIAGVCAGIARALGADVTLVRLVFAVLALAGGAGILVYLALWAYARARRVWMTVLLAFVSGAIVLSAIGFGAGGVFGLALVVAGLWLALRRGGSLRPGAPVSYLGLGLAAIGVAVAVPGGTPTLLAPGAVAAGLIIIVGPWLWRLVRDRDAERAARVRSEERTDMAARGHDSVLQTLALIQRHAAEPQRVEALARRQERELRGWLYDDRPFGDAESSLVGALAAAAADVEEAHGVRVELASGGDCPLDDSVEALVLAAREAMTNAAKFADTERIDVYAEVTDGEAAVFVHDRGVGFDRAAVPPDRRGLVHSIEGRLVRAGGPAASIPPPGVGAEGC